MTPSPISQMTPAPPTLPEPREKDVQRSCDTLAAMMGYETVNLSQPRASGVTIGLPDRYYVHVKRGRRLWFETKASSGKLTEAQYRFLVRDLDAGGLASCGTEEDLAQTFRILTGTFPSTMTERCRDIVRAWAAKGFR